MVLDLFMNVRGMVCLFLPSPPLLPSLTLSSQDMLCFSGNHSLSIKASTFPTHQQKQEVHVHVHCIYMHIHVCTYVHTCTCTYLIMNISHIHVHSCTYIHVHYEHITYTCACVHIHCEIHVQCRYRHCVYPSSPGLFLFLHVYTCTYVAIVTCHPSISFSKDYSLPPSLGVCCRIHGFQDLLPPLLSHEDHRRPTGQH